MLIPTCMVKLLELVLAIACLTLHNYSYDLTDVPTLLLCSGTYVGYIVVFSGEIVGEILFAPLELVQDMFFGLVGMGLFLTSGVLTLVARLNDPPGPRSGDGTAAMVCGCLAILAGILCMVDLSLAYLDSEEFDDEASV